MLEGDVTEVENGEGGLVLGVVVELGGAVNEVGVGFGGVIDEHRGEVDLDVPGLVLTVERSASAKFVL
jgi:hypothetical protein